MQWRRHHADTRKTVFLAWAALMIEFYRRGGWTIAFLGMAAMALAAAGCTYSGGKNTQANSKYQASTADSYTYQFERRTPPGGD